MAVASRETKNCKVCPEKCDHHSNSLANAKAISYTLLTVLFHVPCTFGEEIIFTINMDHAIFQDALPFILNSSNLL